MDLAINLKPFIRSYPEYLFLDSIVNNEKTNDVCVADIAVYDSYEIGKEWEIYCRNASYSIDGRKIRFLRNQFDIDSSKAIYRRMGLQDDSCEFKILYQQYTNSWDSILFYVDRINSSERIDDYPSLDFVIGKYCNGKMFMIAKGEFVWIDNPKENSYVWFRVSLYERILKFEASKDGEEWETFLGDINFEGDSISVGCIVCLMDNQYNKYLCNNFITIMLNPLYQSPMNYADFIVRNSKSYGVHPLVRFSYDTNRTIFKWYKSLWNYVTDKIQNSVYLQFILNERYIPGSESYQKLDYNHENLVFGYDEDEMGRKYHILNLRKGKPVFLKISESDLERALTENDVIRFKYQPDDNPYSLDVLHIYDRIEDYLNGCNITMRHGYIAETAEGEFGISIYDFMMGDNEGKDVLLDDVRISYLIYEHKKCMQMRFAYLYEWGLIPDYDYSVIKEDMKTIVGLSERIMLLIMKNQCSQNVKCCERLDEHIKQLKDTEIRCYRRFLAVCDVI